MEWLVYMFPMIIDSFKGSGSERYERPEYHAEAKVYEGQPVAQMLKGLGMPHSARKIPKTFMGSDLTYGGGYRVQFKGKMCVDNTTCEVTVHEGIVVDFKWIKPEHMGHL